ncbi:MAG: hypothetical protein ABL958_14550 [Bdellovibrionia bacterium]
MKFLILAFSLFTFQAQAKPLNMSCLSAGGYYGSIQAITKSDGRVHVTAAQGFSFEIASKLFMKEGMSELRFSIAPEKCLPVEVNGRVVVCRAGTVRINGNDGKTFQPFLPFNANIELVVVRGLKQGHVTHTVTLQLHPVGSYVTGAATVEFFTQNMGGGTHQGCLFR